MGEDRQDVHLHGKYAHEGDQGAGENGGDQNVERAGTRVPDHKGLHKGLPHEVGHGHTWAKGFLSGIHHVRGDELEELWHGTGIVHQRSRSKLDEPGRTRNYGKVYMCTRVPVPAGQLRRIEGHHGAGGALGAKDQSTRQIPGAEHQRGRVQDGQQQGLPKGDQHDEGHGGGPDKGPPGGSKIDQGPGQGPGKGADEEKAVQCEIGL
eukprot:975935-Heterocapsa_arctica.AAC.1